VQDQQLEPQPRLVRSHHPMLPSLDEEPDINTLTRKMERILDEEARRYGIDV
jgi:hypothetical protein